MLVPYEVLTNGWWYDKSAVKGFEPPKTTEDLFALLDNAKKDGTAAVAQDGDIDFYNAYFFTQWAEQHVGAGGVLDAALDKSGATWKSEPGFLKAAQLVERLAKGGYFIDGWDASKFPNVQNRWADGDAAYLFVGSWITSEADAYLKKQSGGAEVDFEFGSFPMPLAEGATHQTVEQMPIGFGVTKKAKNAEATKALIAYTLNKENISPISDVAQNLVPRTDVAAPTALADIKAHLDDPESEPVVFMDAMDGQAADWTKEVFYPLNNRLLKGELSAQEFIDQLSSKSKSFY
jgi:raffinose/stachyose/melibiose transport system substrate-binding protein